MEKAIKDEILFFLKDEMRLLEEQFAIGGKIIWLTGKQGIGKTTLVKAFAEKIGDYEYFDFENTDVGDDFHEKLKALIQVKQLVILDNYDYRFRQNGRRFLEVSKLQKKLGESGSTVVVVSRERLIMYPMFVYMASLLSQHNYRIDIKEPNYRKIFRNFKKDLSERDRILISSCLDGMMCRLAVGLSGKSIRENVIGLLGFKDFWMNRVRADHEKCSLDFDDICKVYKAVADGFESITKIEKTTEIPDIGRFLSEDGLPYLSCIRYYDFMQSRPRNTMVRFSINDQSMKFFFRFVFDYVPGTDAGTYYDERIAPYLEAFAEGYLHVIEFGHNDRFHAMDGWLSSSKERVHVALWGLERVPDDILLCDYNVSDSQYGTDRLDAFLEKLSKARSLDKSECGISVHLFSLSGFTEEVEKKAQEMGVMLYNDIYKIKSIHEWGINDIQVSGKDKVGLREFDTQFSSGVWTGKKKESS